MLILVNLVVSAAVVLTVLFLWNRTPNSSTATATATATPIPTSTLSIPEEAESVSPASPTPPAASPVSSEPLLYTIQEGDTLGNIAQTHGVSVGELIAANDLANPNVLHVGQTLIIPTGDLSTAPAPLEPSPTAIAGPTPLPTLTPSNPPLIEIGQVLGSGDLAAEVVIVRNRGGAASLEGWTLSNVAGDTFIFPALTLFTDVQVRVHSMAGNSTPSDLYWGRAEAAWTGGELLTLRDAAGDVVDTYIVP